MRVSQAVADISKLYNVSSCGWSRPPRHLILRPRKQPLPVEDESFRGGIGPPRPYRHPLGNQYKQAFISVPPALRFGTDNGPAFDWAKKLPDSPLSADYPAIDLGCLVCR
jgi:hypothetical protein